MGEKSYIFLFIFFHWNDISNSLNVKVRKAAAKFTNSESGRWEGCTVEMEQVRNYLLIKFESRFVYL